MKNKYISGQFRFYWYFSAAGGFALSSFSLLLTETQESNISNFL